ncbi:MAG: hypothetical protein MR601_08775 [Erysipelotrichaceae bacterium]|nr:hypothetical protein [Erysipelotrichaceae bacterium]
MKKQFITVFDESVNDVDKICVSGGKIGIQIEVLSTSLLKITNAKVAKITV